ncbi:MAG: hypothetical protein H6711_26035 [Myxococcales bacterium]|nr:hypothetical protein [Myxococcales bacterium]
MPADSTASLAAQLAFTRPEDVAPDDRGSGLLRARTLDPDALFDGALYDRQRVEIHDGSAPEGLRPELRIHGFDRADLSGLARLQAALERVRSAGRAEPGDAAEIRRRLRGRSLPLVGGGRLRILFIAGEGFIMRKAGPGTIRHGVVHSQGINGHEAAVAVHADQDVDGTPVRQLLRGLAPRLFHHDSPTHRNARSRLVLVNLWIGLDQATRPLALMDPRTLDRRAHQLRYGLPTDAFLERRPGMRVNDIWTFLHDPGQRWHFFSELDARTALVFETLSAPHGSFVVPGEARAELRYRQVIDAAAAIERGDLEGTRAALDRAAEDDGPAPATAALARAIAAVDGALAEGRALLAADAPADAQRAWAEEARRVADRLVRKSIEMRAVGLLTPGR